MIKISIKCTYDYLNVYLKLYFFAFPIAFTQKVHQNVTTNLICDKTPYVQLKKLPRL